ncbi:MAG: aminoglycoside phosphotransferase family protein [Acaryochloridaceae cyanobacterium RU_4_10]|nr:aminoglycoside phosphotransferase family protein [Acaryochloridaceae cyanobacterium RU_4_10]
MTYTADPVFQAIEQIRNPAAIEPILIATWENWLGEKPESLQVKPTLTYYRPFDRARIVAEMTATLADGVKPIVLHLFFNAFADPEVVSQEVDRGYELPIPPNAALPVFAIADWQTVVWTLPHAPCLPELSALLQPEYFCPLLIDPSDLPPAPEAYPAPDSFATFPFKRAIFTWDSPITERRYFIKLCTEKEFPKVVENFSQIYNLSDRLSFAVPEPVTADAASRTFSMRALAGEQFTNIMRQTQPEPFARVGRLLAELHHADLHPQTIWTPEKELKTLGQAMADVTLVLPHLSESIERIICQVTEIAQQIAFPRNYPIHANLFGDQILYSCDRIGMVDWDTLSLGDPHYDIGRLIAHFLYLAGRERLSSKAVKNCIAALLQGYEAEITWTLDRTCLTWQIATQLLLRGKISSLRKLPCGWQEHLEFVVAEAEWLMVGCSEYVSLPALMQPTVAL